MALEIKINELDSTNMRTVKRKLNNIARTIEGVAALGKSAIEDEDSSPIFKVRFERAKTAWDRFQELWDSLDEIYVKAKEESKFPTAGDQAFYDLVLQEMDSAKVSLYHIQKTESNQHRPDASLSICNVTQPSRSHHLPRVSVPCFSGDLLQWRAFKDVFSALIHEEPTISNVEKFNYLREALKGEPASLIAKLSVSADTYEQAWKIINDAYDNPRVLASHYIRKVLEYDSRNARPSYSSYQAYLSGVVDNIEAFKNLKLRESTEFLLTTLALRALDKETRREFELAHLNTKFPSTSDVFAHIRNRLTALKLSFEGDFGFPSSNSDCLKGPKTSFSPRRSASKYNSHSMHTTSPPSSRSLPSSSKSTKTHFSQSEGSTSARSARKVSCPFCNNGHLLYSCFKFRDLPQNKRLDFVKAWKGCLNCLREGHQVKACKSKYSCRVCGKKHHSLVHEDETATTSSQTAVIHSTSTPTEGAAFHAKQEVMTHEVTQVLLGTAQIFVLSSSGQVVPARALLDSCSQYTFITTSLARRLGGGTQPFRGRISGLGGVALDKPSGVLSCSIFCREQKLHTDAVVVENISSLVPSSPVPLDILKELTSNQNLADTHFGRPGVVDVLIGGDVYPKVITGAPVATKHHDLYLLPTIFGLVPMGKTRACTDQCAFTMLVQEDEPQVEELLKTFWETEEPSPVNFQNPMDTHCEKHFIETHYRTESGRYVVTMPVASLPYSCGNNQKSVTHRFFNLERKFNQDSDFAAHYITFMKEYLQLGHMSPAKTSSEYLIPHHGIWQGTLPKRKLRVVFDASCSTMSNSNQAKVISLNDILLSGPKLQPDIADVLMRFRLFAIAITADIVKMYRQILVHPGQRHLQHILWRDDPSKTLEEYELNTLTYGLRPSAFLAIRTIHQLVQDEGADFALAAEKIPVSMYVDDILAGTDSVDEAIRLRQELVGIFNRGGFALDKWSSNVASLIPPSEGSEGPLALSDPQDTSVKILGLRWEPIKDVFSYFVTQPTCQGTKRSILSAIARIFDPLGLLAPVVFLAKCIMQDLWKAKLQWDEALPKHLLERWLILKREWSFLSNVAVPRSISWPNSIRTIVGFCDASEKGYAAAVYLRSERISGEVKVHLIKAKSKVAPAKYMSIARLELCGALLLARTLSSTSIPGCDVGSAYCFTDSMVVLAWLNIPHYKLKTFEANRVSAILAVTHLTKWRHVRSEENPADIASRGSLPKRLLNIESWWKGPSWLAHPEHEWPVTLPDTPPDLMQDVSHAFITTVIENKSSSPIYELVSRSSNLQILVRTVVRIMRFLKCSTCNSLADPITSHEFNHGLMKVVYFVQRHLLPPCLFTEKGNSRFFRELTPFIDEDGLVRVGGRLKEAPIDYSKKHPLLIPKDSHLAKLLIIDKHTRNFHSGPNLTLSLVRSKFWIPGGLRTIKGCISHCVHCRINNAKSLSPRMGDLPKQRFSQFKAFIQTGVDFAGPFLIRESKRRRSPRNPEAQEKAYLCIFICMASKAVHLECVSSLTTAAFLAAPDRFIARRGAPQSILSDNGTNFVGASRYLKDLYIFLKRQETPIVDYLSPKGIEWTFIPPRSPHFGGLWEAGVKAVKRLLVSSVGPRSHTFEELNTIFVRIEGLLNSRPLVPISEDTDQFDYLTPSHFLLGAPMTSIPDLSEEPTKGILSSWDSVRDQVNCVWRRWRQEYLHHLQQRTKWKAGCMNLKLGDLVILLEKRCPTGLWPVARVESVHPGDDGTVRVVTVRTPSGSILKRAVQNLAPLFFPEEKVEI